MSINILLIHSFKSIYFLINKNRLLVDILLIRCNLFLDLHIQGYITIKITFFDDILTLSLI